MGCLSLRGVISTLSAGSVAIVAIITLSITLTSSLAALRDIGKSHAASLLSNANLQTQALFEVPATIADTLRNATMSTAWAYPTDDPATFTYFSDLHRTLYMTSHLSLAGIVTYFYDNVRMGIGPLDGYDYLYRQEDHRPAPYSTGGIAYQRTQPIDQILSLRYTANHSVAAATDRGYQAPRYPAIIVRDNVIWNGTFVVGTLNGASPVFAGVYLVAFNNATRTYVPVLSPLYTRGSKKGPSYVYGYNIALLYTTGISDFLKSVGGTPNTQAFAYDGSGYLIGSSYKAPFEVVTAVAAKTQSPLGCVTTDATASVGSSTNVYMSCRTHASQYPFEPLKAAASDNTFLFYQGQLVELLYVGSDVWYAAVSSVALRYPGMKAQLILMLPEADVIGDVVTGRNIAIGITCGVFVVVAALSFVLISLLLAPLSGVAERMREAAMLQDEGVDRPMGAMSEVRDLQEAYYAMNDELNRIKSFVPQSVLHVRGGTSSGDDVDAEFAAFQAETSTTRSDSVMKSKSFNDRDDAESTLSHARSRKSSSQSLRTASTAAPGAGTASLNTSTGIDVKYVSVLVLNHSGFTAAFSTLSRDDVVSGVAEIVTRVSSTVKANAGVLQSFHGDHFVATFNAVRHCATHARMAAMTALKLIETSRTIGLGLQARVGVATSKCHVGNLGSAEMKVYNVIGPAFVQASLLERMTRLYGPGCSVLAPRRTCVDIATHLRFRYVDLVTLPGLAKPVLIAAINGETESALRRVASTAHSEWLYVLDRDVDADAQHNEAFELLSDGQLQAAIEMVSRPYAPVSASISGAVSESGSAGVCSDSPSTMPLPDPPEARVIHDRFDDIVAAMTVEGVAALATVSSLGRFYDVCFRNTQTLQYAAPHSHGVVQ